MGCRPSCYGACISVRVSYTEAEQHLRAQAFLSELSSRGTTAGKHVCPAQKLKVLKWQTQIDGLDTFTDSKGNVLENH